MYKNCVTKGELQDNSQALKSYIAKEYLTKQGFSSRQALDTAQLSKATELAQKATAKVEQAIDSLEATKRAAK